MLYSTCNRHRWSTAKTFELTEDLMPAPSGKTQTHFKVPLSLVEARMNSKAAQLRENGTEIVRLFARFALDASFLPALADRFGLWGPHGAKNDCNQSKNTTPHARGGPNLIALGIENAPAVLDGVCTPGAAQHAVAFV